jgi:hypothetical protein
MLREQLQENGTEMKEKSAEDLAPEYLDQLVTKYDTR